MKIAFCLGGLEKGGAERVAVNLCNYFVETGNDVVLIPTKVEKIAYELNSKIEIKPLEEIDSKSGFIKRNINRINQMKKIIIDYEPNVIISFLKEPTTRLLTLRKINKKIRNIPIIISIRVDPKVLYKSFVDKITLKLLYENLDGYVFQTTEAKEFFNKKIQDKSKIIGNSLNPKFFENYKIDEAHKKIVTVGRLEKQKNQKLLIDAFEKLQKEYNDYELYIYGDGPLREELQNYINSKKLNKNVFLKGNVDDVISEIIDSKMFVLTSDYEGLPNALMEALALGIPCISTDCSGGGAKELINNNQTGILIEKNNVSQLYESMKKISDDEEFSKTISKNAKKAMQKYKPETINKEWFSYIEQVVKEQN